MTTNIYKEASERSLRFNINGNLAVENLWNLSVQKLDNYYQQIQSQSNKGPSLLGGSGLSCEDTLRCEIIKDIVESKIAAKNRQAENLKNQAKEQRILKLIAEKKDAELSELSIEELTAMLSK